MTEDEKAAAALDLLAGIRRCLKCRSALMFVLFPTGLYSLPLEAWHCPTCATTYVNQDQYGLKPMDGTPITTGVLTGELTRLLNDD